MPVSGNNMNKEKKCNVIYKIQCPDCDSLYIGETKRTLGTRLEEHQKTNVEAKTAVGEHLAKYKHKVSLENIDIIEREERVLARKIKEAIYIRNQQPELNRDDGHYLAPIWNNLLSRDHNIKSRDQDA